MESASPVALRPRESHVSLSHRIAIGNRTLISNESKAPGALRQALPVQAPGPSFVIEGHEPGGAFVAARARIASIHGVGSRVPRLDRNLLRVELPPSLWMAGNAGPSLKGGGPTTGSHASSAIYI